jgi:multidrug efflux pump subunit AcrA (membrane-fusion protein)
MVGIKKWNRFFKAGTVFILFAMMCLVSCRDNPKEIKPEISDIEEWVFSPGNIQWDGQHNISAQTDGILMGADFEVGDIIKQGTLVAFIDNQQNRNNTNSAKDQLRITTENITSNSPALKQLSNQIKTAEARYNFDKSQAERYALLFKNESVTKVEYENMQLLADNSLLSLNALKEQYQLVLQQAKQQNFQAQNVYKNSLVSESYNKVIAVQPGQIVKKLKSSGDFIRRGEIIAVAADMEKTEIILNIDESVLGKIKPGQTAIIKLNTITDSTFKGKVVNIEKAFDEQTQSFLCKVILDERLPDEYNIFGTALECNILTGTKNKVLLIPREYLGIGNTVKLKGSKNPVSVKTGIRSTDYVEVISGITEKDILLPVKP